MTEPAGWWPVNGSAFTPKAEARTKWDPDRVITWDVEAHDWTDPIAVGAYEPDGTYHEWALVEAGVRHTEDGTVRDVSDHADPVVPFVGWCLRRKHRGMRFVAHNGGNYDFGFVLDELLGGSLEGVPFNLFKKSNGDVFYIEIEDDAGHKRHFQDSVALMPRPLDAIADDMAEVGKLDPDAFDVGDLPDRVDRLDAEARAELSTYLRRDCVALRQCLDTFEGIIRDLSDGRVGPQLTIGSTTVAMYQVAFMEDEDTRAIPTGNRRPDAGAEGNPETAAREAYQGGRTEVFRQHAPADEGPYYHYDVNSLFPHAYTNAKLPVGKPMSLDDPDTERVIEGMREFGGPVKVSGRVPDDAHLPVLPSVVSPPGASADKVLFGTGGLDGEWHMLREVLYAIEAGALKDVTVEAAHLCPLRRPFRNYGSALYERKSSVDSEANPALYLVIKLLLNGFYGKWGMKRQQTAVKRFRGDEADEWPPRTDGKLWKPVGDGDREIELEDKGLMQAADTAEADYIVPRVAASITAEARIEMHKWFRRVRDLGGRVWYCDTDSIVTDVQLPAEHVGEALGEMDHEKTVAEGYFLRPKTYAERHHDTCPCCGGSRDTLKGKGMRGLTDHVEFDDYRRAFHEDDPGAVGSEWRGPRGLWATVKDSDGGVETETYERSLSGFDDKRDHSADGRRSDPVDLDRLRRRIEREEAERRSRYAPSPDRDAAVVEQAAGDRTVEDQAVIDPDLSAKEQKDALWKARVKDARR